MATSGSTGFTLTAQQIVNRALSKIHVKTAEVEPTANEMQDGIDSLNLMIKAWGAQGLHLWSKEEGVLFLDAGKTSYNLGVGGDKSCDLSDFVSTTLTSANIITDTVLSLSSSVGIEVGDNIGVEADGNIRLWSTVLSVDSLTQVTINDPLTIATSEGASVFVFTDLMVRPNRILSYRRKTFNQDNEIPIINFSRDQYFNQVNKNTQGTVVNCYYSPQLVNGVLYTWQAPSSVNDFVRFTYERPLQDILSGDDTVDFPNEWLEAIIYSLAAKLSDDYMVPPAKADRIEMKAMRLLDDLLGWDEEISSLNIQPDFS